MKMEDAYSKGIQILLNCPDCETSIFTPLREKEEAAVTNSDIWKQLHEESNDGHVVSRTVYYYA